MLENVFTECLNEKSAIVRFACWDKITILSVVRLQNLYRESVMDSRIDRLLENWLANTVRHCRVIRLFDMEVHRLSRDEQISLANACLDYFENEVEKILDKKGRAKPAAPSPRSLGGDGEPGYIKPLNVEQHR